MNAEFYSEDSARRNRPASHLQRPIVDALIILYIRRLPRWARRFRSLKGTKTGYSELCA
jgi:hypothetical protein